MLDLVPTPALLVAALVAGVAAGAVSVWWARRGGGRRRPADVPAAAAPRFHRARRALSRGHLDRAATLSATLPATRSVRILRGLIAAARARRDSGVERVLLELGWAPRGSTRRRAEREGLEAGRVADVMATRADLIDDLCADAVSRRPAFEAERGPAIRQLEGADAPVRAVQLAEWWAARRDRQTGRAAMTWAALRLLDGWCFKAAQEASRNSGDPELVELIDLAAAAASPVAEGEEPSWRLKTLIHAPHFADELGLLLVGAPVVQELGAQEIASRLRRREALVERTCELWPRYGDALSTTRPFVLHLLTDCGARHSADVPRFERWWAGHRETQRTFTHEMSAGLLSVQAGDWELAEHAFRDAMTAWPERQCARFGLAVSLEARGNFAAAEALVRQLKGEEPDEPLWHMKLGDIRVLQGDFLGALTHLERASELGPFLPGLNMRMGVVLARLGRGGEAMLHLRAEMGQDVDVEQLEQVTAALSSPSVSRRTASRAEPDTRALDLRWPGAADDRDDALGDDDQHVDDLTDDEEEPLFH